MQPQDSSESRRQLYSVTDVDTRMSGVFDITYNVEIIEEKYSELKLYSFLTTCQKSSFV